MQQLKCAACGVINTAGQTVCVGCGTALVAPLYVEPDRVIPSTVVVEDRGMSDAAKILTGLFVVVGLVIVGVLFFQWGQVSQSETELERARLEQTRDGSTARPTPPPATSPAPIIVTTPAQPPTVITPAPSGSPSPTDEAINQYKSAMDPVLRRWHDAFLAAEAASGANLESAIAAMREVERSASMVTPPDAGQRVHARLMGAMQALISEFTEAARKQTAVTNSPTYVESRKQFDAVVSEIEALSMR
jgi:hypothetical protein